MVHKLFVEGQVPAQNEPRERILCPFIERAFKRLVDDGFLDRHGGADVGEYLCQHERVDEIHITGSDRTHDAIVFGVGEEGAS